MTKRAKALFFLSLPPVCLIIFLLKNQGMIHVSKIFEVVQCHDTFSLSWVSSSGELVKVDECRCTSFFSGGKTMNVLLPQSKMVRKVNRLTIVELNGQEVFI